MDKTLDIREHGILHVYNGVQYMKPFLVLSSKHWLTGVAGSANSGIGGIFKLAPGVSAIRGIGTFSQVDIGLLQAGPTGANGGSEVVDTPISGAREPTTGAISYLWVLGDEGHIYRKDNGETAPVDFGASNQISNPAIGLAVFQPAGGTKYLYYWQNQQIGRVALTTTPAVRATGWTDNWQTGLENTNIHPAHILRDGVYFGNDYYIGFIRDNGAGDVTYKDDALNFPQVYRVHALED